MEIITRYGTIYNVNHVEYYTSGALKVIYLNEDKVVPVSMKAGKLVARNIITFYETGEIESMEPAYGTRVKTFIGVVNAYHPYAEERTEEKGSLHLTRGGEVSSLAMVQTGINLIATDGTRRDIVPRSLSNAEGRSMGMIQPLQVRFLRDSLEVIDSKGKKEVFSYKEYRVQNFTCNKILNVMSM